MSDEVRRTGSTGMARQRLAHPAQRSCGRRCDQPPGSWRSEIESPAPPLAHGDHRLTVVIPNYSHGHLIGVALDSALAQTRRPDRILIIDDASSDDSLAVVKRFAAGHPNIDILVNPARRGVIATLNRGLSLVRTEYVTFLAADDYALPTLYEKTLTLLDRYREAPLCTVLARWVDPEDRPMPQPAPAPLGDAPRFVPPDEVLRTLARYGNIHNGNGAVYRTEALRQVGGFDPSLRAFTDGYVMQRLSIALGFCYVPEELAVWRRQTGSYSHAMAQAAAPSLAIVNAVLARWAGPDGGAFPPAYRRQLEARLRFAAASAALADPAADAAQALRLALGSGRDWAVATVLAAFRILGPQAGKMLLFALLRPFDLPWAVYRRISRSNAPRGGPAESVRHPMEGE